MYYIVNQNLDHDSYEVLAHHGNSSIKEFTIFSPFGKITVSGFKASPNVIKHWDGLVLRENQNFYCCVQ